LKDKIQKQQQLLQSRLGLDVAAKLGMNMSEIVTTADLSMSPIPEAHSVPFSTISNVSAFRV